MASQGVFCAQTALKPVRRSITSSTTPDTTPLLVPCAVQPEALMTLW